MKWSEIDRKARLWTVPAERMKNRKPHAVRCPGSPSNCWTKAAEVLGDHEFVFASAKLTGIPINRAPNVKFDPLGCCLVV